jgi:hypothetical protein
VDFVGQPNDEFKNPMKFIFVDKYARHDITEILLKVALNTITLTRNPQLRNNTNNDIISLILILSFYWTNNDQ